MHRDSFFLEVTEVTPLLQGPCAEGVPEALVSAD